MNYSKMNDRDVQEKWPFVVGTIGMMLVAIMGVGLVLGIAYDAQSYQRHAEADSIAGLLASGLTGVVLDGTVTKDGFRPIVEQETCPMAMRAESLGPGLVHNDTVRTESFALGFEVKGDMPPIDWVKLTTLTQYYYGVYVGPVEKGGIDLVWNGEADVPEGKAGSVMYASISYPDGSTQLLGYRIEVYLGENIEFTLLHEIGHVLGLDHALNAGNIMHPAFDHGGYGLLDCQRAVLAHVHLA